MAWSVFALLITIATAGSDSGVQTTTATPKQNQQLSENKSTPDSRVKTETQPQTKPDADSKAISDAASKTDAITNTDDKVYLQAVNSITFNTFVEAQNVGDQLKQFGSRKMSADEFADFMDTDIRLWDVYIAKVQATHSQDAFLHANQAQILDNLNKLKSSATVIQESIKSSNGNGAVKASQDMVVTLNAIKQNYSEATSQMPKYEIHPNWRPNN